MHVIILGVKLNKKINKIHWTILKSSAKREKIALVILKKYPNYEIVHFQKYKKPDKKRLEEIMKESCEGYAETPCGCFTEIDGTCPHGLPTWFQLTTRL